MNLGIVILNWNGEELLSRFLPSLIKFTPIKHNIYIIDNGSNDNSIGFVENNYKRVKVIKLDSNYGYAKGYNIGLKNINDEILCLLNNDVEVTENWTDNILKQFDLEPNTAVIQPKLKNYYEKSKFDYAGAAGGYLDKYGYPYCDGRNYKIIEKDLGQYDKIKDIFWACGACFFVRKKIFEDHNGFDERFWAHMEEIDLCWRIQNSSYRIRYNNKSIVFHANAATLDQNNPKKTYLNFRNKLFMITKNAVDYNGTIPEKYDVVEATHKVFAEYGNVGTDFEYITQEGFGWMNASYQYGLSLLKPELINALNKLKEPDVLF